MGAFRRDRKEASFATRARVRVVGFGGDERGLGEKGRASGMMPASRSSEVIFSRSRNSLIRSASSASRTARCARSAASVPRDSSLMSLVPVPGAARVTEEEGAAPSSAALAAKVKLSSAAVSNAAGAFFGGAAGAGAGAAPNPLPPAPLGFAPSETGANARTRGEWRPDGVNAACGCA